MQTTNSEVLAFVRPHVLSKFERKAFVRYYHGVDGAGDAKECGPGARGKT